MSRIAASLSAVSVDTGRLWRTGVLALVGATLVFVAGFVHPERVHNAAHDARHAFATPCH